jgi:4-amino-4-deoxy-L-arabinose transferase-like glycosyltransferase
MTGKKAGNWIVLIIHLLVIVLYHHLVYIGHYGYDDMEYAEAAVKLINGQSDFTNHFTHRLSIVVPAAISFLMIGINDLGAALPALVYSILIAILVAAFLWKRGPLTLSIGLSLTILPQWFLFYSDKLMPDMAVAFYVFAAFAAYWFGRKVKPPLTTILAVTFSLALLLGFLAKGTIVLVLPWIIAVFFMDMRRKRNSRFWLSAALSGAVLLALYFAATWIVTGSIGSRFTAIAGNAYLNDCSYDKLPIGFLLERISVGFWKMGIIYGLLPGMIFVVAGFVNRRHKTDKTEQSLLSFSLTSAALFLLSANFMTISPLAYNPMCLDVRHYLFLFPILAVPSALVFERFLSEEKNKLILPIVAAAFAAAAYLIDYKSFEKLWLLLALLVLVSAIPFIRKRISFLIPLALFAIMLIRPWEMFSYSDQVQYAAQKDWTLAQLEKMEEGSVIYTSAVQERLTRYYLGFDTTAIKVRRFDALADSPTISANSLLLFNPYTSRLSALSESDLPYTARYPDETAELLSQNEKTGMQLFRITHHLAPRRQGSSILYLEEDFEDTESQLEFTADNFLEKEGKAAYRLGEYSATWRSTLDSNLTDKTLFILLNGTVYTENETTPSVVVELTRDGAKTFRNEINLIPKLAINGAWNNTGMEVKLPTVESGDQLIVYIWNPENGEVYLGEWKLDLKAL